MAWRFVIEGDSEVAPSIKPWLRSVLQGDATVTVATVEVQIEGEPSEGPQDLLATIGDGDA